MTVFLKDKSGTICTHLSKISAKHVYSSKRSDVDGVGFEPATSAMPTRRSFQTAGFCQSYIEGLETHVP